MLIVCPECVSSYRVEPAALAGAGTLHCAHCRQAMGRDPGPGSAVPRPPREGSAWGLVLLCGALLVLASGVLAWRGPIARTLPGAANLYRLAGLPVAAPTPVLRDIRTVREAEALMVEGTLSNPNAAKLTVPHIRITVRDAAAETLYSWTAPAPKASLDPGESVSFTSRLDKVPADGRDLTVGFAAGRVALSEAVKDAR